jgi:hypothetical protein
MSIFNKFPRVPEPTPCIKPIIWQDDVYCVVAGPFPEGFMRSLAFKDVKKAISVSPSDPAVGLLNRISTSESKRYAKTLRSLIQPTHNEWGEIAP